MSDFYQTGVVATFHRLRTNLEKIERDLTEFSEERGISLVLPALFSEIHGLGLRRIVSELKNVNYLREIVLSLGPCSMEQFWEMKRFLQALPQKVTVIWNSGPRMQTLYSQLLENGLDPGPHGKGLNAWIASGYVLAERKSRVICLHDCDIVTYNRELLGRLLYPVVSSNLEYEFCKGFYSRITNKMNGRVTRLFMGPLVRALQAVAGNVPILGYFDSFRYPLAGEFAMSTGLARQSRIPSDWGLEVGVLAEAYRHAGLSRVCQSELCENYDHKHQALSPDDAGCGLNKMSIDIAKALFRTLSGEGIVFSGGFFGALWASYRRLAQDMVARYCGDAALNGLSFDRHEEESAVEMFAEAIRIAGDNVTADPMGPAPAPNWARVFAAIPDFYERLLDAVTLDNSEEERFAEHVEEAGHI